MKTTEKYKSVQPDSEGIKEVKQESVVVQHEYFQTYKNSVDKLFELTGITRPLLDYLLSIMTETNRVFITGKVKNEFIEAYNKITGTKYHEGSVNRAIKHLKYAGLLIETGHCTYQLNPMYFWGERTDDRIKVLKMTLTFIDQDKRFLAKDRMPMYEIERLYDNRKQ